MLPNTMVWLASGTAGVPFGATVAIGDNAIVFNNYPWGPGGAMTLGNVILNTYPTLDMNVPTYEADAKGPPYSDLVRLGTHERAHTYQYQALGPFFLPAYLMTPGAFTARSPFESAADRYARTGAGWWPW